MIRIIQQVMPLAERFLYVPMAGMSFAVAALTARCAQLPRDAGYEPDGDQITAAANT